MKQSSVVVSSSKIPSGRRRLRSWLLLASYLCSTRAVAEANKRPVQISYVFEPFEGIPEYAESLEEWYNRTDGRTSTLILGNSTVLHENDSDSNDDDGGPLAFLFGKNAVQANYSMGAGDSFVEFGMIETDRPHNCHGATHFSMWFKHEPTAAEVAASQLRLSVLLFDDTECLRSSETAEPEYCSKRKRLESSVVMEVELLPVRNITSGWQRLNVPVANLSASLNLRRLRGWAVRLDADSSAAGGMLTVDQLECIGGGDLFGAAFYLDPSETYYDAVEEGTWRDDYFQSNASRYASRVILDQDGVFQLKYTIEMAESWGGYVAFYHLAPGSAYYNLTYSGAGNNHVALNYQIDEIASIPGRASARLILQDVSDCTIGCDDYHYVQERWYSFHRILDLEGASGQLVMPLIGSTDPGQPFWMTSWSGIVGNRQLDPSYIKGFALEFVVDSVLELGELVRGAARFSDLTVLSSDEPGGGYFQYASDCAVEPELWFDAAKAPSSFFTRIEFLGNKCCQICYNDATCLYALSDGQNCYISHGYGGSGEGHHQVGVENQTLDYSFVDLASIPEHEFRQTFRSFWMDDALKRGDFCDLCSCVEEDATIDCRQSHLRILPKTFSKQWKPRLLDLRENPELFLIGAGSFEAIASRLETLLLPVNIRHLPLDALTELPRLESVVFEDLELMRAAMGSEGVGGVSITNNAIAHPTGAFGDVCCSRGTTLDISVNGDESHGLIFCDLEIDSPGIDSTYEPFMHYIEATFLKVIFPTSKSLSEASESKEMCAEYCTIVSECHYWDYDARFYNAEHICYLYKSSGAGKERVCCDAENYADLNQTEPGWVAGKPPQTRRIEDRAMLLIGASKEGAISWTEPERNGTMLDSGKVELHLVADSENDFQVQYELSLGCAPRRGAVWVEPKLAVTTEKYFDPLDVVIQPSRIILYDANMTATVTVSIHPNALAAGHQATLIIQHDIESCDSAFRAPAADHVLYVQVKAPPVYASVSTTMILAISIPLVCVVILIGVVGFCMFSEWNRRKNDAVWKINVQQLQFPDPPVVVGRGTFGLVVQAEYRGTQVAVKRVIPPRARPGKGKPTPSKNGITPPVSESAAPAMESFSMFDGPPLAPKEGAPIRACDSSGTSSWCTLSLGWMGRSVMSSGSSTSGDFPSTTDSALFLFKSASGKRRKKRTRAKKVAKEQAAWRKLRSEFIDEMRHLSKLRHPCITTVMGAVIDPQIEPMMVMELMHHGSLYDILQNETMLVEADMILPILQDISQGVRFLHSADPQVVHGDLKAANILVDGKFRAKVADFGLSIRRSTSGVIGSECIVTGTPYWMAPELLRRETPNTPESDIYSFGIIIYECFSRKEPYHGEEDTMSPRELLKLIADKAINKRPSPLPSNCPAICKSLMVECLHSDANKRPTAVELNTRLKRIDLSDVNSAPPATSFRSRNARGRRASFNNITLSDIFPRKIADALRDGRPVEPEYRDCVTIFFSDIIGFTDISASFSCPGKVADMLDRLYGKFDELSEKHNIFKVETIGDAYMAVTNLVEDQPNDHAKRIAQFAIDAVKAANETLVDVDDVGKGVVNIRVGFHSGPVVADVVGSRSPRYCLFGDTVNTAARMESNSRANRIHCSAQSADLLREQYPELPLVSRGMISIKGKGDMHTYWIAEESVSFKSLSAFREDLISRSLQSSGMIHWGSLHESLTSGSRPQSTQNHRLSESMRSESLQDSSTSETFCEYSGELDEPVQQNALKGVSKSPSLPMLAEERGSRTGSPVEIVFGSSSDDATAPDKSQPGPSPDEKLIKLETTGIIRLPTPQSLQVDTAPKKSASVEVHVTV